MSADAEKNIPPGNGETNGTVPYTWTVPRKVTNQIIC